MGETSSYATRTPRSQPMGRALSRPSQPMPAGPGRKIGLSPSRGKNNRRAFPASVNSRTIAASSSIRNRSTAKPSSCDFPSGASRPTRHNPSRHCQTPEARPGKPTGSTNTRGSRRSSPHKSTRAGELGSRLNSESLDSLAPACSASLAQPIYVARTLRLHSPTTAGRLSRAFDIGS